MAQWVAVHGFINGENAEESVLNRPVYELVERTNYLFTQIQSIQGGGLFESVRVSDVDLVTEGDAAPVIGDWVYLDPVENKYAKAIADVSSTDAFRAADSSFTLGLLVSSSGGVGTIVLYGKETLATDGAAWDLSDLLEAGEVYRDGPYYLSTVEAGKLTSSPSGPAIYIGFLLEDATNPGYGGIAMLSPQYKDMQEAHQHRAYALYSQPAGTQVVSGPTPIDTHTVQGFTTETAGDPGDQVPRLVLFGNWTGLADVQYTIWLSNSSDPDEVVLGSSPPTSWANAYLHWASDDPTEGSGTTRIWSYESPVSVGTKGVMASLENSTGADWDDPYTVASADEDKRTWIVDVPTQTRGWLANKQRLYFTDQSATPLDYSFILMGGPHAADDDRINDLITVKCAKIWRIVYTGQPADGEQLTIDSVVFEFDNNSSITGDVAVEIGATAEATYSNLLETILAQNINNVDASLDTDAAYLIIGATTVSTVSITNAVLSNEAPGAGDLVAGTADFLVYDQNHASLVPTDAYWANAEFWVPVTLSNGLEIMAVPYDQSGSPSGSAVAIEDYWDVDFGNEGVNANFAYSMPMHQTMSQHYPPLPAGAASLVLNGVELDPYSLFPSDPTYRMGKLSLYWYSDTLGSVPWPRDWVSVTNPGSAVYVQNALFHFVRMSVGNTGLVTSLRPAPGSPIAVLQCGTNEPGTVGDLALDLNLQISEENASLAGYQVFKEVEGQKLRKGPVVEKILSDGTISVLSSGGAPDGQGTVILGVGDASFGGEFEEVALQNAKQELIGMFPYIRLLGWETDGSNNIDSAFVAKFRVPHTIDPDLDFRVIVYMTVFGEEDIPWVGGGAKQYAGINFTYTILPDFNPIPATGGPFPDDADAWNAMNQTLPDGLLESNVITAEIPLGKYVEPQVDSNPIYAAYDPMLIHNNTAETPATDVERKIAQVLGEPFPQSTDLVSWPYATEDPVVKAGSLVGIRVARSNLISSNTEYTGSIGFINLRWKLVRVV